MAQLGNVFGVTDKRATQGAGTIPLANPANYASESAMDTRLTAYNSTTYTAAKLKTMSINDKIYALRLADDAAGVK